MQGELPGLRPCRFEYAWGNGRSAGLKTGMKRSPSFRLGWPASCNLRQRLVFLSFEVTLNNPFPILIKPTLIINNKSRALKIPHEHFKRGCTNLKGARP